MAQSGGRGGDPIAGDSGGATLAGVGARVNRCAATASQDDAELYLPNTAERADIAEGEGGAVLRVRFWVSDVGRGCAPVPGVEVEVWHANAYGAYSGVVDEAGRYDTVGQTFLRGRQRTDEAGFVEFTTRYPGWYPGRAPHIDYRIRSSSGVVTSQLYLSDDLSEALYLRPDYAPVADGYVRTDDDPILRALDGQAAAVTRAGTYVYMNGFMAEVVVGIEP